MARTSLLVAVLLLVFKANRIDCSTGMTTEKPPYDCEGATYYQLTQRATKIGKPFKIFNVFNYIQYFKEFVKKCAPGAWKNFFAESKVQKAIEFVARKIGTETDASHIQPQLSLMFKALEMVAPEDVNVVILGQDPTPQEGEATGLAFSVKDPQTVPSVMNVLLEVALEGWSVDLSNGDLSKWANQGVLLLNSALTVQPGKAGSHLAIWCPFTKLLIRHISLHAKSSAWILWGKVAQDFTVDRDLNTEACFDQNKAYNTDINKKPSLIDRNRHYVVTGDHPSTHAAGRNFFGGNYFFCANEFLFSQRSVRIDWGLAEKNDERLLVRSRGLKACPTF